MVPIASDDLHLRRRRIHESYEEEDRV